MKGTFRFGAAGLAALLILVAGGCTSPPATPAQVAPSPKASVHSFAGGCAGTLLTDAEPPVWAQTGWTHRKGSLWGVPWALGTQGTAVAYLFATQLVAGGGPRADGTANKILWEAQDDPSGASLVIQGRPAGRSQPAVTMAGGPSIVDLPMSGCWIFTLYSGSNGQQTSTIGLEVLPTGTLPPKR